MTYLLTNEADHDLVEIYDYTASNFSEKQADDYLDQLMSLFDRLEIYPDLGIKRSEIHQEIRSIAIGSHIVFYKPYNKSVLIVRILHHSRDFYKYLKT